LRKLEQEWDPMDRFSAVTAVQNAREKGEILTGLLYVDTDSKDLHDIIQSSDRPLNSLSQPELCPGSAALAKLNDSLR